MRTGSKARLLVLTVSTFFLSCSAFIASSQRVCAQAPVPQTQKPKEGGRYREIGLKMLGDMKSALKEKYYDPKYHGIDLDGRFKAAEERIKTLSYNWQVFRVLAQVLLDFQDSHTTFIMPPRTDHFEYGFSLQIIGDKCFVTRVKKDSDAEAKGLRVGDQVISIGRWAPDRTNLWKIMYVLYRLDPIDFVQLKIKPVEGDEKQLTIKAKTMTNAEKRKELEKRKKDKRDKPYNCQEINSDVIACKFSSFSVRKEDVDKMMKLVGSHSKLILDLRGNRGGYVDIEEYLTGYFFDRDIKIGDMVRRKKTEERIAKSKKDKVFKGELLVLIDSNSASAAEVFARVIQLQKRGIVIGDVSDGSVMTSIFVPFFSHLAITEEVLVTNTGMSITIGDLIMSDGKRLENVGVVPDIPIIPTALALSQKTDPVLSVAAIKLGAELTPEKAGSFHFIIAEEEDESEEGDGD